MKRYTVTWGDESKVVSAASEQDAWAVFCDGNDLAKRLPKSRTRSVKLAPPEVDTAPVKPIAPKK